MQGLWFVGFDEISIRLAMSKVSYDLKLKGNYGKTVRLAMVLGVLQVTI